MAAPGLTVPIIGKAIILAGSTTAKLFSGAMAVVGIGFGIWDLYSGITDICGSELADQYLSFADRYREDTNAMREGVEQIMNLPQRENE
jgi:hypothetical protein